MSYEYSSEQAQLDFPNPYRVENMLWSIRATILLVCALSLIFLARKHLAAQAKRRLTEVAPDVPVLTGRNRGAWRQGQRHESRGGIS